MLDFCFGFHQGALAAAACTRLRSSFTPGVLTGAPRRSFIQLDWTGSSTPCSATIRCWGKGALSAPTETCACEAPHVEEHSQVMTRRGVAPFAPHVFSGVLRLYEISALEPDRIGKAQVINGSFRHRGAFWKDAPSHGPRPCRGSPRLFLAGRCVSII